MEQNFSIDEILTAVNDLQNRAKPKKVEGEKIKTIKSDNSNIPKNTLQLIEEAEKIKN